MLSYMYHPSGSFSL